MKRIFGFALSTLVLGGAAIDAHAITPSSALAPAACSPNGRTVTIGGKTSTTYCGSAQARVRIGAQTMTFRNGTCSWTSNSFRLQLGTIFLFRSKPVQRQDGFSIYATGYPVARALIEIYWHGRYYFTSTLHATARPTAARAGGTFTGRAGKTGIGPSVSGTITCS